MTTSPSIGTGGPVFRPEQSLSVSQPPRYDQRTPSIASVESAVKFTTTRRSRQGGRQNNNQCSTGH